MRKPPNGLIWGPLLEVKRAASGNWHRPGGRDPLRNIQNGMEDMGKKTTFIDFHR